MLYCSKTTPFSVPGCYVVKVLLCDAIAAKKVDCKIFTHFSRGRYIHLFPILSPFKDLLWFLNFESVVSALLVATDYGVLFGRLSNFFFAFCSCLLFFCFWLLFLSFFPPLSPIVCILSFSTIHHTCHSRLFGKNLTARELSYGARISGGRRVRL